MSKTDLIVSRLAMKAAGLKIRAAARFSLGRGSSRKFLSSSSLRKGHGLLPQGPTSIAYAIPREVLQAILASLTSAVLADAFPFAYGSEVWSCPINTRQIALASHTLYCVTLVCRSWYAIGTPVLYSIPALFTGRRIQLFRRTLEEVPSMTRHVKNVLIVDAEGRGVTPLRIFKRLGKYQQQVLLDLTMILDACRSLHSAVIGVQGGWMPTMGCSLLMGSSVGQSLRKLIVYGKSLHSSFSELELPSLEILCLRDFPYFSVRLSYPLMPRLQTLQLVTSYVSTNIQFAFRPGHPVPPLKSLELYGAHSHGTLIDADSLSYFDQLESLHLIGRAELRTFIALSQPTTPLTIRHLVLGIIPSFFGYLEEWKLPTTLETLTLFVDLVPVRRGDLLSDKRSLPVILECLRFNNDHLASGTFHRLTINAISDFTFVVKDPRQYVTGQGVEEPLAFVDLKDFTPGPVFAQIKELCNSTEVEVQLNHVGTSLSDSWTSTF